MNGINGIGGINTSLYLGADAMQTHTIGMQVCAHDVANISTANFLPQREIYATGPSGMGVDLDAVIRDPMPLGGKIGTHRAVISNENSNSPGFPPEVAHPSGTDLAREMPHMISTQRAFQANAKTVMAADDLLGTLLNISA
jgi:flagellar basal-body rod protein FlgC